MRSAFLVVAVAGLAFPAWAQAVEPAGCAGQAPKVISTLPVSGSHVPPGDLTVTVVFSCPMRDGAMSVVTADDGLMPALRGRPAFAGDQRTFQLHVRLAASTRYALWLNNGAFQNFQSIEGRSATPYHLTFQTGAR